MGARHSLPGKVSWPSDEGLTSVGKSSCDENLFGETVTNNTNPCRIRTSAKFTHNSFRIRTYKKGGGVAGIC
jgi:hypothetical protein